MKNQSVALFCTIIALSISGLNACGDRPPQDALDYESCLQMNAAPIQPVPGEDPHEGVKDVYLCHVDLEELFDDQGQLIFNYPEGALMVKVSQKEHQSFPWLMATMRKRDGAWRWAEYTRNFGSEPYIEIPVSESLCIDCHQQAEAIDWVFTVYSGDRP